MGTIKKGILGGFARKVGTVVGFHWKGKSVMRSLAVSVSNPRTEAQIKQRSNFKTASQFLSVVLPAVKLGWSDVKKMSPSNAALSYMLKNSFNPDGTIDFAKVKLSKGHHIPINSSTIGFESPVYYNYIEFSKPDGVADNDLICCIVYNEDRKEATLNSVTAIYGIVPCPRPSNWITGDKVFVWCFVIKNNL
jgi:hypothetical protein